MTPADRCRRILDEAVGGDLSSWERFEFIESVRHRSTLSDKQEKVLKGIEARLFEEGRD